MSDLRLARAVIDAAAQAPATPGRLPDEVLLSLRALVPCDVVVFADLDVATATEFVSDVLCESEVEHSTGPVSSPDSPFWKHYPTSPPCSYPTNTGDDVTITQLSDFYSLRQWRATAIYADAFTPNSHDHELMCCLPSVGSRSRRVLFFRRGGPDFSYDDRAIITLLRPHLVQMYARQEMATTLVLLTSRQIEVARLLEAGHSNIEIASILCLSALTVRTHLENIYERLGVTSRSAAVARLFPRI
jgi:DNA-binding CsgD family transcriptional regulator